MSSLVNPKKPGSVCTTTRQKVWINPIYKQIE